MNSSTLKSAENWVQGWEETKEWWWEDRKSGSLKQDGGHKDTWSWDRLICKDGMVRCPTWRCLEFWCHNSFLTLKFEACVGGALGETKGEKLSDPVWAAYGWTARHLFTELIQGKQAQRWRWWRRRQDPEDAFLTPRIPRGFGGPSASTECRVELNNVIGPQIAQYFDPGAFAVSLQVVPTTAVWESQRNSWLPGPYFLSFKHSRGLPSYSCQPLGDCKTPPTLHRSCLTLLTPGALLLNDSCSYRKL